MKLSMNERLRLLNILPEKGDITAIRVSHELRQNLAPSDEEWEEFGFFTEEDKPDMLFWNQEVPQERDVEISKAGKKLIEKALTELSENEGVTLDLIPLFDKFVEEEK